MYTSLEPNWQTKLVLRAVHAVGGGWINVGPPPIPANYSRIEDYNEIISDKYCYSGPTKLSMGKNLLDLTEATRTQLQKVTFPFLALHGTSDTIAFAKGSQLLYQLSATQEQDKKIILITDALHNLIIDEPWRSMIVKEIVAWVRTRIPKIITTATMTTTSATSITTTTSIATATVTKDILKN